MMRSASSAPSVPALAQDHGGKEIRLGVVMLTAFFGLFLGWAALAPLDAAVVANGAIVVAGNRQLVQHRDGGVISHLAVKEGDRVTQGQVLVELSAPELVGRDKALLSQIADLQMQRARLTAEAAGARTLARPPEWTTWNAEDMKIAEEAYARHAREARALGAGRGGAWSEYNARIAGYREQIASSRRQEALLQDELEGMRTLAEKKLVPLTRVRALERALAESEGRRGALDASIATTQQERSERLRDVEARLNELTPQFFAAREQVERMKIRAPMAGVVVGLDVHTEGGVIAAGQRVMEIVPDGRDLVVEARVRPEDADNLRVGGPAEVRVTAFKGRNVPPLYGKVSAISADRFVDERTGTAYFTIQVSVPAGQLARLAKEGGSELRPGLPAEIMAKTRKRTALQFLFEPLDQTLRRSLREE